MESVQLAQRKHNMIESIFTLQRCLILWLVFVWSTRAKETLLEDQIYEDETSPNIENSGILGNRNLQASNGCEFTSIDAGWNENPEVIPFVGIMFQMQARNFPLEILTFEVDVLTQGSQGARSLKAEVYTKLGQYDLFVNKPDSWDFVADANLEILPDGKAVIPARDFMSVFLEANERRSFYITLTGKWLDYKANGLVKAGDVASEGADLTIFAGSGLNEIFADSVYPNLSPQFAGAVHYRRRNCAASGAAASVKGEIEYQFILNQPVSGSFTAKIARGVENVIGDALKSEPTLNAFVGKYGLEIQPTADMRNDGSYASTCPNGWILCPTVAAKISFSHSEELDQGEVLYNFYILTEKMEKVIQASLKSNTQIAYVGYRNVAAYYEITLRGIPAGEIMGEIQQNYFKKTTKELLEQHLLDDAKFLYMAIDKQYPASNNLRDIRSLQAVDDTNVIAGQIYGAQLAHIADKKYAKFIKKEFTANAQEYVTSFTNGILFPGEIHVQEQASYFDSIKGFSSSLEPIATNPKGGDTGDSTNPDLPTTPVGKGDGDFEADNEKPDEEDTEGMDRMTLFIAGGAGVVGIFLISFCCICGYYMMKKRSPQKEALKIRPEQKKIREESKQRRRRDRKNEFPESSTEYSGDSPQAQIEDFDIPRPPSFTNLDKMENEEPASRAPPRSKSGAWVQRSPPRSNSFVRGAPSRARSEAFEYSRPPYGQSLDEIEDRKRALGSEKFGARFSSKSTSSRSSTGDRGRHAPTRSKSGYEPSRSKSGDFVRGPPLRARSDDPRKRGQGSQSATRNERYETRSKSGDFVRSLPSRARSDDPRKRGQGPQSANRNERYETRSKSDDFVRSLPSRARSDDPRKRGQRSQSANTNDASSRYNSGDRDRRDPPRKAPSRARSEDFYRIGHSKRSSGRDRTRGR